MSELNVINYTL